MKTPDKDSIVKAICELNRIARENGGEESMLDGLTFVACAFRALLETYAAPNPDNPAGMCEDKEAFCRYFAAVIAVPAEVCNNFLSNSSSRMQ